MKLIDLTIALIKLATTFMEIVAKVL